MLGDKLLRFKKEQKYLTWDWETCNLSLLAINNRGWQIGWMRHIGTKLVESHEDWLLWNDLHEIMSRDAAAITRFDFETYRARAKDPAPIMERFDGHLFDPDTISITANGWNFDLFIEKATRELLGKPLDYSFCKNLVCIQNLEKAVILGVDIPKIGTNAWIAFNVKMGEYHERGLKTNLKLLCERYEISYDPLRHHAESQYDSQITKEVFDKVLWKIELEKV